MATPGQDARAETHPQIGRIEVRYADVAQVEEQRIEAVKRQRAQADAQGKGNG
jgi:hypothetical protein